MLVNACCCRISWFLHFFGEPERSLRHVPGCRLRRYLLLLEAAEHGSTGQFRIGFTCDFFQIWIDFDRFWCCRIGETLKIWNSIVTWHDRVRVSEIHDRLIRQNLNSPSIWSTKRNHKPKAKRKPKGKFLVVRKLRGTPIHPIPMDDHHLPIDFSMAEAKVLAGDHGPATACDEFCYPVMEFMEDGMRTEKKWWRDKYSCNFMYIMEY